MGRRGGKWGGEEAILAIEGWTRNHTRNTYCVLHVSEHNAGQGEEDGKCDEERVGGREGMRGERGPREVGSGYICAAKVTLR